MSGADTYLIEKIRKLILPVLAAESVTLVDIKLAGFGKGRRLRIFIDRPGGVTVEDCAGVSRKISDILDMEDVIEGRYMLEVSSPGIKPDNISSD
ncbi:MAG TPA: hypothetical protein EYP53_07375 [Candidatus Latescibacteria bacterium]|nr:hypothetical protein [Candidatus Latescibacterota bacterium]